MIDTDALSREFCELAGICWHNRTERVSEAKYVCSCGVTECPCSNPDFTDAREVLKAIDDGKGRLPDFLRCLVDKHSSLEEMTPSWLLIAEYVLDTTGLLLNEAVKWMINNQCGQH